MKFFTKSGWQNLHWSEKEILKMGKTLDFL